MKYIKITTKESLLIFTINNFWNINIYFALLYSILPIIHADEGNC
jgi:hypothetical protein